LIRVIDEAIGSVVLVTPSDPKAGFTASDQKYYYALQTAMLAQKASGKSGDVTNYYSDAEYFGGYGYTYVIGIDGGATFLNNYVAGTFDYVSRIAGMLLINGKMEHIRNVAALVPVYRLNQLSQSTRKRITSMRTRVQAASKNTSTRRFRLRASSSQRKLETLTPPYMLRMPTTICS
jgi:hypothetical protein